MSYIMKILRREVCISSRSKVSHHTDVCILIFLTFKFYSFDNWVFIQHQLLFSHFNVHTDGSFVQLCHCLWHISFSCDAWCNEDEWRECTHYNRASGHIQWDINLNGVHNAINSTNLHWHVYIANSMCYTLLVFSCSDFHSTLVCFISVLITVYIIS